MESWALSKHKPWLCRFFICMMMMLPIFIMVGQIQGVCIEEERKALLEIKAFLHDLSYTYDVAINLLPTWVDHGNTGGSRDSECCDWERVKCNRTTGHVTDLSLSYMIDTYDVYNNDSKTWPLNVSLFLHFKELRSLDLSSNPIDSTILSTGCKSLSKLKRLETVTLRSTHLDKSIISCLSFLPSLKNLDLSNSPNLGTSFPMQELSSFRELEALDLSDCSLQSLTSNGCKSLSRLKRLETVTLSSTYLNKSVILSCLSFLPSLKNLDLSYSPNLGSSFPMQELSSFRELEALDLSYCRLQSLTSNGTINNKLVQLMLDWNSFNEDVMRSIAAFPSLRILSLEDSFSTEMPLGDGFCGLKNLHELGLSGNMFNGSLPECFNRLSSLKLFDISSNLFTGTLPPSLIANLTSLEYVDFSHNMFEGSISFSLFSNHTKLEVVGFISDNDKFVVITEEPRGWIPTFQLKVLALSNCNINRPKGSGIPSFLLLQHKLQLLDLSHNSLEGHFPNWLIKNNTVLEFLSLSNNLFDGNISMLSLLRNSQMAMLDISGNLFNGTIPSDIHKIFPNITHLNMSSNSLDGAIPSSVGDLSELMLLDFSHNQFTGEVPAGLFTNLSQLRMLKLSNNSLQGEVLSGNLSLGNMERLQLDSNLFTGKIGSETSKNNYMYLLDISSNSFSGMIPGWISNMSSLRELFVRNNRLEGRFPCGTTSFSFLDISHNSFSGPIPSCLNWQYAKHLHLGSNRFTGSVPASFGNLTAVLTLELDDNSLSGKIPEVLGELSNLRILLLGKNKFSGSIPKQLCQLRHASLIDLSSNSLSGSIPPCIQNITGPDDLAFEPSITSVTYYSSRGISISWPTYEYFHSPDEVQFTTKGMPRPYKGNILNYMAGLDLSCNKLTGEIPPQLGMLTQIRVLNLSHNQLTGPIPVTFSNLSNIESMDLSSNSLSGKVPSELTKLNSLAVFNVSNNNLSGRLPDMEAQFGTFTNASYEGNPFLCGPPLEKQCTSESQMIDDPSAEDGTEKWYDINMASFYGSWIVFMLGFAALLYTNPYWRRRWLDFVEECMYTCYYFLYDLVRKPSMLFRN